MCPCIWGLRYQVPDFYQLWCSERRIERPLGAQRKTRKILIWLLKLYWQNAAFLALTDWLIDWFNQHPSSWTMAAECFWCFIYLCRRDVFKICMISNILHVLFLLQLAQQGRDSLKGPQIVPSSPRTAGGPDLKLLRGSRWAEIFWNAWNAEHSTLLLRVDQQQWCGWRGRTEVVSSQHGQIMPHCVLRAAQLTGQVLHLIYWVTSSEPVRTQTFYTFLEHSTHHFSSPFKQFISETEKTSVIRATWNSEQV